MAMERADVDVTPLLTALPLNDDDGAKADAEAVSADRMKATVLMVAMMLVMLVMVVEVYWIFRKRKND